MESGRASARPNRPVPPPPAGTGGSDQPPTLKIPSDELQKALGVLKSIEESSKVNRRPLPPPPVNAQLPATPRVQRPETPAVAEPVAATSDDGGKTRKRQLVCQEILATEERYVEQLDQIMKNYQEPLRKAEVLTEATNRAIFGNINVLAEMHHGLMETLRAKVPQDQVGDALCSVTAALTLYIEYINQFHDGGVLLRKLAEKRKFAAALNKCQHSNLQGLTGLETLLVVPVQRIPRYVLLLREVLKFTPESHPDFQSCQNAFHEMEKITSFINEKKREYESMQRLTFISQHVTGGNVGSLRETAKITGKKHDFVSSRILIPHTCDWCKETVMLQIYRCTACGYQAHFQCTRLVPVTCSELAVDRDSQPELIKNYRKILKEGVLHHKCTQMNRLMEYESTPFEPKTILLCNDSMCILKAQDDGGFSVVDLVKWSSSHTKDNALLNQNVAEDLFSLSNRKSNLLHTFRGDTKEVKTEWTVAVDAAISDWKTKVRVHEEHEEAVTQKLSGLHFHINGTVPVASAFEKPFTVYIIQMTNERGTLTILKRYRQLLALHHRLEEIYGPNALPKFPRKKLIGNTDEKFLQKRARQLEEYLEGIVKLDEILKHAEVRQFLTTTVSAKNEDELLPAFAHADVEPQNSALSSIILSEVDDDEDQSTSVVISDEDAKDLAAIMQNAENREQMLNALQEVAIALYDYKADIPNCLSFKKGDTLTVLSKEDEAWWFCRNSIGEEGYCPEKYLTHE